jgi:hypothetical protein
MFSSIKKYLAAILIAIIIFFSLISGYSTRSIDNLAYVIAIGLDVGKNDNLNLSIQLIKSGSDSSSR